MFHAAYLSILSDPLRLRGSFGNAVRIPFSDSSFLSKIMEPLHFKKYHTHFPMNPLTQRQSS